MLVVLFAVKVLRDVGAITPVHAFLHKSAPAMGKEIRTNNSAPQGLSGIT